MTLYLRCGFSGGFYDDEFDRLFAVEASSLLIVSLSCPIEGAPMGEVSSSSSIRNGHRNVSSGDPVDGLATC